MALCAATLIQRFGTDHRSGHDPPALWRQRQGLERNRDLRRGRCRRRFGRRGQPQSHRFCTHCRCVEQLIAIQRHPCSDFRNPQPTRHSSRTPTRSTTVMRERRAIWRGGTTTPCPAPPATARSTPSCATAAFGREVPPEMTTSIPEHLAPFYAVESPFHAGVGTTHATPACVVWSCAPSPRGGSRHMELEITALTHLENQRFPDGHPLRHPHHLLPADPGNRHRAPAGCAR